MSPDSAVRRRTIIVLACCLGAGFGTLLDSSAVNYAVPSLRASLGASTQQVQWFLASYSLTFGLGLVPAGRLGDTFGRKTPLLVGLALFLGGGLFSVFAPEIWWSIVGRMIQGLGGGIISAQVLGLIQDEFQGLARLRALSGYGVASALSSFAGPMLSAITLQVLPVEWSWRAILALNIPFIVATLLVALIYEPQRSEPADVIAADAIAANVGSATASDAVSPRPEKTGSGRRPLGSGSVSLDLPAISLLGILVILVTLPVVDPLFSRYSLWLLVAVPVLIAALIWWERRYAARGKLPLFVPALLTSRGFVVGNLVALFWFGAILAKATVLTLYLLSNTDLSPIWVAVLFLPGALSRLWSSSRGTAVYQRLGAKSVPIALAVEVAAGFLLLFATLGEPSPARLIWATIAFGVISGFGSGVTEPVLRAVTFSHAPSHVRGVAASFFQLVQRLAATFFVALATGLLLTGGALGLTLGVLSGVSATVLAFVLSLDRTYRG